MESDGGNYFQCEVNGKLPDAWLVKVKDITQKPTEERTHEGPGGRNWEPKKKKKN